MKIWTMEEIDSLGMDQYIDLMPDEFLDDPEAYCRKYGKTEYNRLVTMVICTASCMIPLNDGSKLNFHEESYHYEPLVSFSSNN